MEDVEKDHPMEQLREQMSGHGGNGDGNALSRQVTVTLSDGQYERLFFQPEGPRRGDLAKRFGRPPP